MATFQVNYSVDGHNGNKDFDAKGLEEAFAKMLKILHDAEIPPELLAETAVKVKNLETGEEFMPNFEDYKLVPILEDSAIE